MFKKTCFLAMLIFSSAVSAKEYSTNLGFIHVTTVQSSWCGDLIASTKVGNLLPSGKCDYKKETAVEGFDNCDPRRLSGYYLKIDAGSGFKCAATHVHSNVTGHDGLDEYALLSDSIGDYYNTSPIHGNINLK